MKLLVSTSRSVLLLDAGTGECQPVHRGAGLYYGLAATPRHYLVAARKRMVSSDDPVAAEAGEILILNQRFEQVGNWQAPFALRDMHEIKWHRRHLWVTCSYDNMVAIRAPDGRWQKWYPLGEPESEPRDRNHFNSLHLHGRQLWLLAHNRGPSEILHFDLATRTLRQRIPLGCQAHNLWRTKGVWHTCSSAAGGIAAQDGRFVAIGDFPRGIAPLRQGWVVGVSQLAERGQRDLTVGQVAVFDAKWRELRRYPLRGEGLILDILPCHRGLAAWARRMTTFS